MIKPNKTIIVKKSPVVKNYLNGKDLYLEILISLEHKVLTDKAVTMLLLLTDKVSKKLSYKDIQDREDCIAYARLDILKYWNRFDPAKSNNAFAYYTEVIKRAMAKGWGILNPKKTKGTISIDSGMSYIDGDGIYSI